MQCRIGLIVKYKQFVLFNSSSIYFVTKRNSTVKLRKVGFSPVASRAIWRKPLSDDIQLLLYFSL